MVMMIKCRRIPVGLIVPLCDELELDNFSEFSSSNGWMDVIGSSSKHQYVISDHILLTL